mmetsp:Transcript_8596/g.11633  ORF Transcript_8596/g.11633 Transcript_8596/m.11633 type:complete len:89 (+) Transcript_8596:35-301(+)|eukprot:CAMPEP_0196595422 /NCGR_PEP_ID=MMETSP1081-20130531/81075_1 /TAXON_ID=36882 /ORGANISM="Pyramimonas amylifera, Strain CCMP720" /LENGTH=88 /DNA_ID=CAMNT_0041919991 /DNA_START=31 /DNA_END=297 /DNA_ORIENTATION=+
MTEPDVLIADVSNSEAFRSLDELLAEEKIDPKKAQFLRDKFSALHDALVLTMDNDKNLMASAKQLNTQLQVKCRLKEDSSTSTPFAIT